MTFEELHKGPRADGCARLAGETIRPEGEGTMNTRHATALVLLLTATGLVRAQVYIPPPGTPAQKEADKLALYLTPEGNLRAPLEVRDEKKGFGTFAGMIYRVAPDGKWSITEIVRREPYFRGQGQLTKVQLRKLAQALVRFDVLNLPNAGRPLVNPHVLTIRFGGKTAELTFGIDQVAAPPNPANPAPDVVSRYGGIAGAVRGALRSPAPKGVPAEGPPR
jgi:hypothetical protein